MPRTVIITVTVPPPVLERLAFFAMGEGPERYAADVLDRWRRGRLGVPIATAPVHHMVHATASEAPAAASCTAALTVTVHEATAEALRRHRFRRMSAAQFAGFLLDRWWHWYELQTARSPLGEENGVPE